MNEQIELTKRSQTRNFNNVTFFHSSFSENVNNCTMTSRLFLPERYVKGKVLIVCVSNRY